MLPKIELRASPSAEGFKPSRINKVRDLDPVDIITELVSFAGIARLISIKVPVVLVCWTKTVRLISGSTSISEFDSFRV